MRPAVFSVEPEVRIILPEDVMTPCNTGLPLDPPLANTSPVEVFAGVIIEVSLMFDSSPEDEKKSESLQIYVARSAC